MQIIRIDRQGQPSPAVWQEDVLLYPVKSGELQGDTCAVLLTIDDIDPERELVLCTGAAPEVETALGMGELCRKAGADAAVLTGGKGGIVQAEDGGGAALLMIADTPSEEFFQYRDYLYFKRAAFFFDAAKSMIRKRGTHQGGYPVLFAINEAILQQLRVIRVDEGDCAG